MTACDWARNCEYEERGTGNEESDTAASACIRQLTSESSQNSVRQRVGVIGLRGLRGEPQSARFHLHSHDLCIVYDYSVVRVFE